MCKVCPQGAEYPHLIPRFYQRSLGPRGNDSRGGRPGQPVRQDNSTPTHRGPAMGSRPQVASPRQQDLPRGVTPTISGARMMTPNQGSTHSSGAHPPGASSSSAPPRSSSQGSHPGSLPGQGGRLPGQMAPPAQVRGAEGRVDSRGPRSVMPGGGSHPGSATMVGSQRGAGPGGGTTPIQMRNVPHSGPRIASRSPPPR